MEIFQSVMHGGPVRIFNPVFFMIFFLLFLYYLLRFLHQAEGSVNNPEKWKKEKLLSAIFFGISFYSQIYWTIYTFSIFIFFVLILYFWERKKRRILREVIWILILGIVIGIPAIIFNFYQRMMIGETVERGLIVGVDRNLDALKFAFKFAFKHEYFSLFLLAFLSFILWGKFTPKYIFIFSSFFGGYLLFFAEYILGIYIQLNFHILVPFRLMVKIGVGLLIEKIEQINIRAGVKILRCFTNLLTALMLFTFIITSLMYFHYSISHFAPAYEKIENFRKLTNWIRNNTSDDSVVTSDDSLFFIDISPPLIYSEVILSIACNRYILYDPMLNNFTDLKHEDIFNRFILRAKLLGFSELELKEYIKKNIDPNTCWGLPRGIPAFCISSVLSFVGETRDFKFPRNKEVIEVINDAINIVLKYYQNESYFEYLLKKYKVDYVVRKKPYQGEWYLREETKIGDFYIFRVIKEKKLEKKGKFLYRI